MITQKIITRAILIAALTTAACGGPRRLDLTASPIVPAAVANAKISSTGNGNTSIELAVSHLAPPARVNAASTVYVVWVRGTADGSRAQVLGALRLDDDLNGRLSAITPLRDFELFVTAEPNQTGVVPTGPTVLRTRVTK